MKGNRFDGKVAIVTGAARGIGLEICTRLYNEGASIIINDIDESMLGQVIDRFGSRVIPAAGDSSQESVIHHMVSTATSHFGKIDIAIANAGITLFGAFIDYPVADLRRVLQVNIEGTFLLAQAVAKQMKKQSHGGRLLFMSSVTGHQAHQNLSAYGMTKAAIEMLAKHLVVELSAYRINVNCIAPGATITDRTSSETDYNDTWSKITPLRSPAQTSDIAEAALFLVSDAAQHITGQSLVVDGGWTVTSPSPYSDL